MFKWLNKHIEEVFLVFMMSIMSILIFVQVIMRYVFSNSLAWSEELARYIFIWIVYISISYAVKERKHIKLDAMLLFFKKETRPYIVLIGDIIFLLFSLFIVWSASVIVIRQISFGQTSPALRIPMAYIYAATVVGFTLSSIRGVQVIVSRIKNIREGVIDD